MDGAFETALSARFERSFGLYRDLLEGIGPEALGWRLGDLPSNTIGGQLWCVIGARESYSRAIRAGAWVGFSCSLDDPGSPAKVGAALAASERDVRDALGGLIAPETVTSGLILDLLEHEAAHQGQLIRYLYGLKLAIPASWKARYALA
jgi:hypothetical protein